MGVSGVTNGTRQGRLAAIGVLAAAAVLTIALAIANYRKPEAPAVSVATLAKPQVTQVVTQPVPPPTPAPVETGYVVRRVLDIPSPFVAGQYYWDEAGAPAGPIVVTVDLKAQVLSIFRAGYEIGTAVITYGADEYPTPLGVFHVSQKDAHHVSNLYGAPMPYMMRLTNDGVSIHGAKIQFDYATHGCVGVPTDFAKLLFGVIKLGDTVIVTRGETLAKGQRVKAA